MLREVGRYDTISKVSVVGNSSLSMTIQNGVIMERLFDKPFTLASKPHSSFGPGEVP